MNQHQRIGLVLLLAGIGILMLGVFYNSLGASLLSTLVLGTGASAFIREPE